MSEVRPRIAITYCTQCRWLLRAAWLAQELLSTFGTISTRWRWSLESAGCFSSPMTPIWERQADGGFPDAKLLKQRVRDRLDPGRSLGHLDRATAGHDQE